MDLNILDLFRMKYLIIIVIAVIIFIMYPYFISPMYQEYSLKIPVSEARARRFGLIIDVRTPKERERGYYPNSIPMENVPISTISKNTWILIYSGERASTAAEKLYRLGYKHVRYINESYIKLMPGY